MAKVHFVKEERFENEFIRVEGATIPEILQVEQFAKKINLSCSITSDNIIIVNVIDFNDDEKKAIIEGIKSMVQEDRKGIILNYTPHTVNIIDADGNKIQDFPSMGEARCEQETRALGTIAGIQVTSTHFGEVTGLPGEKEDTYYIVSRLIRQALSSRNDLLVPNDMVRDEQGRIIGCKSLANN